MPGFSMYAPVLMTALQLQAAMRQFIEETKRDTIVTFSEIHGKQRGGGGSAKNLIAHIDGSDGGIVYFENQSYPRPLGVQGTMYEVMALLTWSDDVTPTVPLNSDTIKIHGERTLRGEVKDMMALDVAEAFSVWLASKIPRS